MSGDGLVGAAQGAARDANDHPVIRTAARVGYVASGLIHLLIGWLALRLALGSWGGRADQSSALSSIASHDVGRSLLWVLVAGFAGLALWQLTEAIGGYHEDGVKGAATRVKAVAKAVVYLALGWTASVFARGDSSSSAEQSSGATATALTLPGGSVLVVAIGAVVVGVGIYHVVKGARRGFLTDLVEDPGDVAEVAGVLGYVAKGVALVIVGGLFGLAGMSGRASESTGLGGALQWILEQPFGQWLLGAVAVGIAAYGVYSFFRARYTVT